MENNNNAKSILGSVIILVIFVLGVLLLMRGSTKPAPVVKDTPKNDTLSGIKIRPVEMTEHVLGNPTADVMIVEYSDTECPFCKSFHSTMHRIVDESDGNIAWVYRHYPIDQLHAKAFYEAEATECAWDQGGNEVFWKYTDEIYARTNSNDSLAVSELTNIARDLDLNIPAFQTCLDSGRFKNKIENDLLDGSTAGVRGTPTSFIVINGEVVDMIQGAQPYDGVVEKLSKLLLE